MFLFYKEGKDPVERAVGALNFAEVNGIDTVILDTAGRLPLMMSLWKR